MRIKEEKKSSFNNMKKAKAFPNHSSVFFPITKQTDRNKTKDNGCNL